MEDSETKEERQVGLGSRVRYRDRGGDYLTGVIGAVNPDDEHPYAFYSDPGHSREELFLVHEDNDDTIELLETASSWNDAVWQCIQAELNRGYGACLTPGKTTMVIHGANRHVSYAVSNDMANKIASLLHGTVAESVDVTFEGERLRFCDPETIRTLARSITNAKRITLFGFAALVDEPIDQPQLYSILQTLAQSESLNFLGLHGCSFPTPSDVDCECWAKICSITRNIEFRVSSFQQITPLWEESLKQGFQRNESLEQVSLTSFSHAHRFIGAFHGSAAPKELCLHSYGDDHLAISEIQVLYHEFFISQLKLEKPALESLLVGHEFGFLVLNDYFLPYDILKELCIDYMSTSVALCLGPGLAGTKNLRSLSLGSYVSCAERGCKAVLDGLSRNKSLEKLIFPVFVCESDYEAVFGSDDDGAFIKVKELVSAIENIGIRALALVGGQHGKSLSSAQELRDSMVDLQSLRSLDISSIFKPLNAPIADAFLEGLNDGLMVEALIWDNRFLLPNTSFPQEEMLLKTNRRINKLVPAVGQRNGRFAPSAWSVILSSVSPKAYGIYQVLQADPTCGGVFLPKDDTPKKEACV